MKDGGDLSYTPCEPQAHFALGTACCVALPQRSRSNLRRLAGKRACRLGFARLSAPPFAGQTTAQEWANLPSPKQKATAWVALALCKGDKKDIFATFSLGLNCSVPIRPKACISSKRSFVYHQGESLVYHHCERRYSLRLMIYTFGDDIHDCTVMIYHCFRNG